MSAATPFPAPGAPAEVHIDISTHGDTLAVIHVELLTGEDVCPPIRQSVDGTVDDLADAIRAASRRVAGMRILLVKGKRLLRDGKMTLRNYGVKPDTSVTLQLSVKPPRVVHTNAFSTAILCASGLDCAHV
jgi:hypothetical protein